MDTSSITSNTAEINYILMDWLKTTFDQRTYEFEWTNEDTLEYGGFILLVKTPEAYERIRTGCRFAVCLADCPPADPRFPMALKDPLVKRMKYLEKYYI